MALRVARRAGSTEDFAAAHAPRRVIATACRRRADVRAHPRGGGAAFPEDPTASGFDNIGAALSLSPLHLELSFDAARAILDDALVSGDQPPVTRWRFEPEEDRDGGDRTRVESDGQRIILNKGKIVTENGAAVMRVHSWDRNSNFRDVRLPHSNVLLTMAQKMGVETDSFQDAMGSLTGLT